MLTPESATRKDKTTAYLIGFGVALNGDMTTGRVPERACNPYGFDGVFYRDWEAGHADGVQALASGIKLDPEFAQAVRNTGAWLGDGA